jgi:hypothetical protein
VSQEREWGKRRTGPFATSHRRRTTQVRPVPPRPQAGPVRHLSWPSASRQGRGRGRRS